MGRMLLTRRQPAMSERARALLGQALAVAGSSASATSSDEPSSC